MFRALQPSEAPGSGGVLASRASAGQRRLSARGVEPAGRGSRLWDQALWSRSNDRAGDRGGPRAGKPRWVRILAIRYRLGKPGTGRSPPRENRDWRPEPLRDDRQGGSACASGKGVHYERRRPEDTVLYQLIQEHLETFLAQVELETGAVLPSMPFSTVAL